MGEIKVKKTVKPGTVRYGKRKKVVAEKPKTFITKPIGGEKNGGTRLVRVKQLPAYYATQLNPKKRTKHTKTRSRALRSSITPGTVCILLAGSHKGKRVVFLKQLASGLCLVTGPFKINACPLRRVNQIYLIATATKVDISGFGIPKHLNDQYFRRVKAKRAKKEEGDIFEKKQEKYVPSKDRKKDQAVVDGMILSVIKKRQDRKMLFGYLGTPFTLRNRMYPHRLTF
ncbi:large ribosomal subunit protein eL6 [Procambarus clarkii]|uniref:large ribosomal subunit protein eL6 n=1 Tax=Procambarus clarkii TaxID=6728 RepID=UPI001E673ECB|nr:60S ribosomal protein L6-like [Procambarus clarkii]